MRNLTINLLIAVITTKKVLEKLPVRDWGYTCTSFLDTPYMVQTVCALFGNGRRDQSVCITFMNVFYIGPLMRVLIQPIAVTNTPRQAT